MMGANLSGSEYRLSNTYKLAGIEWNWEQKDRATHKRSRTISATFLASYSSVALGNQFEEKSSYPYTAT